MYPRYLSYISIVYILRKQFTLNIYPWLIYNRYRYIILRQYNILAQNNTVRLKTYSEHKKECIIKIHSYYNHTPYIKANILRINPTIQNSLTISFSFHPNLSK